MVASLKEKKPFPACPFYSQRQPTPLLCTTRQAPWQEYICSLLLNNIFNLTTIQKMSKYRAIKIKKWKSLSLPMPFHKVACVHNPAPILQDLFIQVQTHMHTNTSTDWYAQMLLGCFDKNEIIPGLLTWQENVAILPSQHLRIYFILFNSC